MRDLNKFVFGALLNKKAVYFNKLKLVIVNYITKYNYKVFPTL